MKKTNLLIALLLLMFSNLWAQKGSFNAGIRFMNNDRTLSCYVPEAPANGKKYKLMICLHGAGDNSENYRNVLVNTLQWPSIFTDVILVCPDGGTDQSHDFYQPTGDENIIQSAINYAFQNYSIDSSSIVLQGFSLGGRSALKYGLDHAITFKGLLLNTPAIQGLLDLENNPVSSLHFAYEHAAEIPIYLTVGETDYTYFYTLQQLAKTLKKYNSPLVFKPITNMAHAIPVKSIIQPCNTFFDKKYIANYEVDLFEIEADHHFCGKNVSANCLIRNAGATEIFQMELLINAGSNSITQEWNGSIKSNQMISIPVNITTSGGIVDLIISIKSINNGISDSLNSNNQQSKTIETWQESNKSNLIEGFEKTQNGWTIQEHGSIFEWYIDDQVKKSGVNSIGCFNTPLLFYTKAAVESFTSPFVDLSNLAVKELSFDIAFNYFKYTQPYVTQDTYFSDTLQVLVSTDCGNSYESIYKKSGKELATAAQPILNPTTIQACFFTPTANQWRKEIIDLGKFASAKNAIFKFNCISGMGGSMNIDNIGLGILGLANKEINTANNGFRMYPNPATETLTVEIAAISNALITLYDLHGNKVLSSFTQNFETTLDISSLSAGLYLLEVTENGKSSSKKLIIQ